MRIFDLVFLAAFLASLVIFVVAAYAAIRGRTTRAFSLVGMWVAGVAVYLGISVAAAYSAPQRIIALGSPWCFDDWCLTVNNASRTEGTYTVNFQISSEAKRVTQRANGAWIYLRDENDRHYDPLPDPAAISLETQLVPGESVSAKRAFQVPSNVRELGLVTGHGGGPCGVLSLVIIGNGGVPVPQADHGPAPDRIGDMENIAHRLKACATFFLLAIPVVAHHSNAAFDMTRAFTVTGVVTKFLWANPHSYIDLDVDGQPWRLEMEAVNLLRRYGWTKDSLKAGEKITCTGARAKDPATFAQKCFTVEFSDGRKLIATPAGEPPEPYAPRR